MCRVDGKGVFFVIFISSKVAFIMAIGQLLFCPISSYVFPH